MSQTEAAIRWAGALVAASTLIAFAAVQVRADVVLAQHAILQLGCAAVLLSTAHGAVADLARRAAQPALDTGLGASAAWLLRWLGFAGIVIYALYVAGNVAAPAPNEAVAEVESASLETVKGFLLFLVFLAGFWAVYLSMVRSWGGPPAAAADEDPHGGEVDQLHGAYACTRRF